MVNTSDVPSSAPTARAATRGQMFAWAMYDWANSSFATLIQTFLFANYFLRQIAGSQQQGQSQWALTIGLAGVAVALMGPPLGAIADQTGRRKPWVATFSALCILATACLWFIKPQSPPPPALLLVAIGTVGAEAAVIFYNAMLPDLVEGRRLGRWSGWGWALGYFGGLACLGVALVMVSGWGGRAFISSDEARHIRATFLLVAIWFALFSLPLLFFTPDTPSTGKRLGQAARDGLRQLLQSIREVRRYEHIVRFLIARLFYIDGLATIFALGGVYASGVFDMDAQQIMLFGIGLNVAAGLGAFGLAWVDDWIGPKWTIILSIVGVLVPGVAILLIDSLTWFWVCGLSLGVFVGPVQAASRSYMARLAPPDLRTQAFGLFAFSGKATSFNGPLLVALVTAWTGSQRWGMVPIFVLLTIGLLILLGMPRAEARKKEAA